MRLRSTAKRGRSGCPAARCTTCKSRPRTPDSSARRSRWSAAATSRRMRRGSKGCSQGGRPGRMRTSSSSILRPCCSPPEWRALCAKGRGLRATLSRRGERLGHWTNSSSLAVIEPVGVLGEIAAAKREFDGPILAKDFFIDPRQVPEARNAGADAVLVMLSLLDDEHAREIIAEARRFGMDALVEVHDEAETARALALGAPLIG